MPAKQGYKIFSLTSGLWHWPLHIAGCRSGKCKQNIIEVVVLVLIWDTRWCWRLRNWLLRKIC